MSFHIVLGSSRGDSQSVDAESVSLASAVTSGMATIISKLKITGSPSPPPLDGNHILQFFEVGEESANAGPGLVWRVHDAYRKSDGKVS